MHSYEQRFAALPAARLLAVLAIVGIVAILATVAPARAATPTITNVNPATGSAAGGALVTITGTGFEVGDEADVTVTFGGVSAQSFNVVDDTTISAVAPAHVAGEVGVVVTTDDGTSNNDETFTYHPFVTSVNPNAGPDVGGTEVTIAGGGFAAGSTVTFGGVAATGVTVVNQSTIEAVTPLHSAGAVSVVVTSNGVASPGPSSGTFTYGQLPTVTGLNPTGGPTGGGTVVTITGTNFTGATGVTFGGNPATGVVVNSPTQITATAPAHAAGATQVIVTTPIGSSAAAGAASTFTYSAGGAVPTITLLAPTTGPIQGGTVVEITGTGFTGATAVTFGATAATSFNVNSSTSITAVAPAHAVGAVFVHVTTPAGTTAEVAASQFTYTNTGPVITSLSPTGGPTAGGTVVTITGTGFTGATSVTFGGTAGTSLTVNSPTSITVTAPSRPEGTIFVLVTTPAGTSSPTVASRYTYGALPTVTGISPASGPIAGGTVVTITGTGFTGATSVTFGGVAATNVTVVNATTITATSPAHAAGTVFVRVTTPIGQSAEVAAAQFVYGAGSTATITYTLQFRWTLISWLGEDDITVTDALSGAGDDTTNDISGQVTAIFRWNAGLQRWQANFPGAGNVPGANDFTTLEYGTSYFIAITGPGSVQWIVELGPEED